MQAAAAVVNPSLFEGWSTSVEEAKSLAVPMVLSDLRVHREQTDDCGVFFDPYQPESLVGALREAWGRYSPGPRIDLEARAQLLNVESRIRFANRFAQLASKPWSASIGDRVVPRDEDPFRGTRSAGGCQQPRSH